MRVSRFSEEQIIVMLKVPQGPFARDLTKGLPPPWHGQHPGDLQDHAGGQYPVPGLSLRHPRYPEGRIQGEPAFNLGKEFGITHAQGDGLFARPCAASAYCPWRCDAGDTR